MTAVASLLLSLLLPVTLHSEQLPRKFAVAISPAPVLNSPGFREIFGGYDGKSLKTDKCGQIRELEFIALPGTSFQILQVISDRSTTIYRVATSDYPFASPAGLYIDSRFVRIADSPVAPRMKTPPVKEEMIRRLRSAEGVRYVWGGNVRKGVPALSDLYPPKNAELSRLDSDRWSLAGLDCSGLLYEATEGATPRNTSAMLTFGKPVDIEGLSPESIARKLKPLDIIVWPGHVLIVLDRGEIIESRLQCDGRNSGVVIRPIKERLLEIFDSRKPSNAIGSKAMGRANKFVVRRWDGAY